MAKLDPALQTALDGKAPQQVQRALTSGNFTFVETSIPGLTIIDAKVFADERGSFRETYKRPDFARAGIDCEFVQLNQSSSVRGVLRGLHFQIDHPQAKLVRVVAGEVFDVAVDLRLGSPTFGRWEGVVLSEENGRQLFVPRGFAHGFLTLSDEATFVYQCDDVYHPGDEGGIAWDDPDLAIAWPSVRALGLEEPILSEKDRHHLSFAAWKSARGLG